MKAIALISGGLDSTLAARLIKEQGIEVIGIKFQIPFHLRRKKDPPETGIETREVDIGDEFMGLLENPRYGFGSNMNPCIDCKILMLRKARALMPQLGAQFIVTGEVLGQRPMSQHREALRLIARMSGLEGLVLRPLSARLLEETIPEKEGWVKRDKLLNFGGRGRKAQMELAAAFGIKEYAQPGGGCLLTEPGFVRRLKDLKDHGQLNIENVKLLKLGRHFRLSENAKLIVGRDEKENAELIALARGDDYLFFPDARLAGPTSLGRGEFDQELIRLCGSITCYYCDLNGETAADIIYRQVPAQEEKTLMAFPMEKAKLESLRV